MASLLTNAEVNRFVTMLRQAVDEVKLDKDAGTVEAKDGEIVVFKGIQKGKGGPWIVRFTESDRIKWTQK